MYCVFGVVYQRGGDCVLTNCLTAGIKWTTVSPKYLDAAANSAKGRKADPSSWREFLLHLGVQSAIAIERIDQFIDPASKVMI